VDIKKEGSIIALVTLLLKIVSAIFEYIITR